MSTKSSFTGKVFSLIGNGGTMQEIKPISSLPLYCKVYYFGYGHEGTELAVISEAKSNGSYELVYMSDYKQGFKTLDKYSKPLSQKFGIGLYYSDELETFEASEVAKYIDLAVKATAKEKAEAEAKQQADSDEKNNLPKLYPHLIVNAGDDQNTTKKNIVATLKKEFPAVKFSVRKDYHSSYYVYWTDGPTAEEVDEKIQCFCDSKSSDCGDFRDPAPSNFNRVFGGFKYVSTSREHSPELEPVFNSFVENMKEKFWLDQPQELKYLPYRIFRKNSIPANAKVISIEEIENFSGCPDEAYKFVFDTPETSQEEPQEATIFEEIEVRAGEVSIVDYSEKSIAVIGDTKPIKEQLKELGGKFNFRLSCGAGWIFQKSKLEEVQKLLQGEEPTTDEPTTLHDEVEETINFLADLDVKMYGEVSESVKECARVQEVEIHQETLQASPSNSQFVLFL